MTQSLRNTMLAGAGAMALAVSLSPSALAQAGDAEALEARIEALEAVLAELRGEVASLRHEAESTEDKVIALEAREDPPAITAASTPPASGFMAGSTRVGYGGFIDVDAHVTDFSDGDIAPTSIARDFYIPGVTPVGGSGDSEPDTDMTAQATRFFFTTETPTDHGPVTSRIEFDFLGSPGGNERVSNSYNPRLRTAWAQIGNWRIGQDWTTFQNTSAIPESASFLIASDGMIFGRQAQIRYTNGPFQFAVENPDTTVTLFGGGGRIDAGDGVLPDLVARYNLKGDFGNIAFAALGRNLSVEAAGIDGNALGWGVSAQGRVAIAEGSDVRFSLAGGQGMGRYIGLNAVNGAVADANGDIEAIASYGGLIALRQSLGGGARFNVGYSHLEADNDIALTGLGATRRVYSGFGNYLITLTPGVTIGAELMFGERELESGQSGSITRATVSTKYSF